jgi:hypothetical protein
MVAFEWPRGVAVNKGRVSSQPLEYLAIQLPCSHAASGARNLLDSPLALALAEAEIACNSTRARDQSQLSDASPMYFRAKI